MSDRRTTIVVGASAATSRMLFAPRVSARATTPVRKGGPPLVIPESQEYYWTSEWQAGEREALAEIAAGQTKEFESAQEAVRWLLRAKD